MRVGPQVQEVLCRTDIRRLGLTPVKTARLRVVLLDVEPAVARSAALSADYQLRLAEATDKHD